MGDLNDFIELVNGLLGNSILPDWLKTLLFVLGAALLLALVFKDVLFPLGGFLRGLYENVTRRLFIKRNMYPYFTELTPREVYEAIQYYIPTRYSRLGLDPANEEEPTPENFTKEQEREGYPLLLNRFLETEFDSSKNNRFYFVLADCGMGKTTFLMNLFYYTLLRKKRHPCKYINMVNPGVIDAVKKIKEESGAATAETILLLDALDENDAATKNYAEFMRELEEEAREFYCVVITSRTNFFEKATEERLPGVKRDERITQDKIVKFYITPFTDNDIQKYLKRRYPWNRKKQKRAWAMMENNKHLAATPMLLKFMDELLNDNFTFDYDFQLYEKLFDLWISRECDKTGQDKKELFHECLKIACAIFFQECQEDDDTGKLGISLQELEKMGIETPSLQNIKLTGHALINRTSAGVFKFAHKSYLEYLLAYAVWHNSELDESSDRFVFYTFAPMMDRANSFSLETLSAIDPYCAALFWNTLGNVDVLSADEIKHNIEYSARTEGEKLDERTSAFLFRIYFNCKDMVFFTIPLKFQNHVATKAIIEIREFQEMEPFKRDNYLYVSVPLENLIRKSPILSKSQSMPKDTLSGVAVLYNWVVLSIVTQILKRNQDTINRDTLLDDIGTPQIEKYLYHNDKKDISEVQSMLLNYFAAIRNLLNKKEGDTMG